MAKTCTRCIDKNRNDARFCSACGARFAAESMSVGTRRPRNIIEAIKRNDTRAVQGFVERGSQITLVDGEGYTPLHWAAEYGHMKLVDSMIRKGADIHAKTWDGWTPLDLARVEAHTGVEKLILQYFSEIAAREVRSRQTALKKRIYLYPDNHYVVRGEATAAGNHLHACKKEIIQPGSEELLRRLLFLMSAPARRLLSLLNEPSHRLLLMMNEPSKELLSLMGQPAARLKSMMIPGRAI